MAPALRYFESTAVGDELPPLSKSPIDRVQLARYAGATGDFDPLHVDEAYARSHGLPSVIAPASLAMGFLAQLATDWAPHGHLVRLSAKFVRSLWPDDTLTCRGRVSDREGQGGRYFVDLDAWAENQTGGLVVRGQIRLRVFYSPEDEARALNGQPPIIVTVRRAEALATKRFRGARRPLNRKGGDRRP